MAHISRDRGQVIVSVATAVVSSVVSVFQCIFYFFQIIYEDNIFIITEELPNFSSTVITGVVDRWLFLQNSLCALSDGIYDRTSNIITTVAWFVSAVSTVVTEVLFLVKRFIILFGDTLWLILTFFPVQVPILLKAVFGFLQELINNAIVAGYMRLLKLTNFLTDVPLESFIGITSAIIIVRLSIHFRENIQSQLNLLYWSVVRKLLYLYHTVYNYFTDSEVRVITRMAPAEELERLDGGIVEDEPDPADALCVICQERQKCVLILPCRHVCLCRDCCLRLYGYQRTCPICRTFIYHSVNIYL